LLIAKNQNTFAKRAREMDKKRKAEEKRNRRKERKAESALPQAIPDDENLAETSIDDSTAEDDE
jgi:septal ring factor EnvC (AmiA/AmiB activator)